EGASELAAHSSALALGKTFAGATLMTVGGDEGYSALGEQLQGIAESTTPYLADVGRGLGIVGIPLSAFSGYQTGGATGAASGAMFGSTDFAVDLALTALGPVGAVAAITYSAAGGSKGMVAAAGTAVMCSAKLHVPPPMVFRQIR